MTEATGTEPVRVLVVDDQELFISENTVKNHVRNILEKLQLHSRMEAVMYAMREKLLDLP